MKKTIFFLVGIMMVSSIGFSAEKKSLESNLNSIESQFNELMKKEGFQNVSVRKIANYLKCSTAPIYFNFNTVDELKEEIIDKCKEKLKKYLYGNYAERKILSGAIGFVIFAREEKELFRTIFLDTTERFEKLYEVTLREFLTKENLLESFPALEEEEAKNVINKIWYFLFGYATMLCTRLDEEIGRAHV